MNPINRNFINILFILPLIFLSFQGIADQAQLLKHIEAGNKAYNEGLFDQAIEQYTKVTDEGYSSAELYYNIGNAYFKKEDIANAVLYFEKALRLDPGNENIEFNLGLANSRTVDKIEPLPELFLIKWWKSILYSTSLDNWARITISAFILSLILFGLFLLSPTLILRKTGFYSGIIMMIFTLFTVFVSYQKYQYLKTSNEAIVFDPTVVMKSSPTDKGVDLFIIHEGTKIFIIDQVGEWYEVKIANGSVGWLKGEAFKRI